MTELEARRQMFRDSLKNFIDRTNIQSTDKIKEDSIVVCAAVEDFDPRTNELWSVDANWSYPRERHCGDCKRQVVMSDGMYRMFMDSGATAPIKCGRCLLDMMNRAKG